MSGSEQGGLSEVSFGGASGDHPSVNPFEFVVGPTVADGFNTAHLPLTAVACWRVDDVRFAFDSSFVSSDPSDDPSDPPNDIRAELRHLSELVNAHPGCPLAIFGHADPVGNDDYNKLLSGRRAAAIYSLLIVSTDPKTAVKLWQQIASAEHWGAPQRDRMRSLTGLASGAPDSTLFQTYLQQLCPADLKLGHKDFLGQGADSGGKGDYQGCSEFNPLLIFSQEKQTQFDEAKAKNDQDGIALRNFENASNRRVMAFLFRKGSRIDPERWPCPRATEGVSGCIKRFWSDGNTRRSNQLPSDDRKFELTQDTFACRFYQRISNSSPCDVVPPAIVPCRFHIIGPAHVPGLSKYKYKLDLPGGTVVTDVLWTVDKSTATFEGGIDQVNATVSYSNSKPDWIKLKVSFTLEGTTECAEMHVALVRVQVSTATFTNPGTASGSRNGTKIFLVNPPATGTPQWVITHDPGSDWGSFTYNGTLQAAEPRVFIKSGSPSFSARTDVTLTSPPQAPDALQKIQIGFIQDGWDSGSAQYAGGLTRTVRTPTHTTVDWLVSPDGGPSGGDEWPWYDQSARETGAGSNTWTHTLSMDDGPGLSVPAQYNPNDPSDPNSTAAIVSAADSFAFTVRIGVRTLDTQLGADKRYFEEAHSVWTVNFAWPVIPGVSIVTLGPDWIRPGSPKRITVNVVSTTADHNSPFLRWEY